MISSIVLLLAAGIDLFPEPGSTGFITFPECAADASDADADGDGLTDTCEQALAVAFAPMLLVRAGGCNWDAGSAPARLGGGYLHAVGPADGRVRIAYLPAYFVDCGWRDLRCLLPFVNCAPHAGDSEFIAIELEPGRTGEEWKLTGVFLSAHCFGRGSPSCRWYRGEELGEFQWHGVAPVVWVAEGRNANYPSWQACNAGHRTMDTCARNDARYRFPVRPERNLGSRARPASSDGCLAGHELGQPAVASDRVECFWDPEARFRGWQSSGAGVTPYERYMREVAGF